MFHGDEFISWKTANGLSRCNNQPVQWSRCFFSVLGHLSLRQDDLAEHERTLACLTNRAVLFHRGFPVCVLLGAFVSVGAGENSDVHAAFVVITLNAPVTSIKLVFKAVPSHPSAPRLDCCIFGHCQSTVNTGHYRSPVGPFTGSQSEACTLARSAK